MKRSLIVTTLLILVITAYCIWENSFLRKWESEFCEASQRLYQAENRQEMIQNFENLEKLFQQRKMENHVIFSKNFLRESKKLLEKLKLCIDYKTDSHRQMISEILFELYMKISG